MKEKLVSEILGKMVKRLKPRGGQTKQRLRAAWSATVGEEKASHTKIEFLKQGTLHIEVESPAMLQELTGMNKIEIKAAMQERLEGVFIADIKLKLSKD